MFEFIENSILPYISGLYTLPWILVGFILTILISRFTGREKIDKFMKKVGLVLLYFFVPVLLFRIFLNTTFGVKEIEFSIVVSAIIVFMYIIAALYAKHTIKKQKLTGQKKNLYLKTVLTNQGRSSAFIGSAMLAIPEFRVPAAIFMALVGIALFAVIPYVLSHMHSKEKKQSEEVRALPWFLKLYPWYLIAFVIAAVTLHGTTGLTTADLGYEASILLILYTAITIPAALYYVGAGIHPSDLKISELRKLVGIDKSGDSKEHWTWVRNIFILTVIITPIVLGIIFGSIFIAGLISAAWFSVIIINVFLPITSTNMFLVPYGIDKKSTAHVVTWTTLICVPIVVVLIYLFGSFLI